MIYNIYIMIITFINIKEIQKFKNYLNQKLKLNI